MERMYWYMKPLKEYGFQAQLYSGFRTLSGFRTCFISILCFLCPTSFSGSSGRSGQEELKFTSSHLNDAGGWRASFSGQIQESIPDRVSVGLA